MVALPSLVCPSCQGEMSAVAMEGKAPVATAFDDCLRSCQGCGIGASNAADPAQVTYIHHYPLQNIPEKIRPGAGRVLDRALNERNRKSKRQRFGFSTSEDAVSWVVFAQLFRSGGLLATLQRTGVVDQKVQTPPSLYLWGAPVDSDDDGLRSELVDLCSRLGENPKSFSEPDVIVDLGPDGLVFIEVKHRSGNDLQSEDYPGWSRYFPADGLAWDEAAVKASGCYELARNWRLLRGLAGDRPATLVNLGPPGLFRGTEGERLSRFQAALGVENGARCLTLTWPDLLGAINDAPEWFSEFCRQRNL